MHTNEENITRYNNAQHAMQSGVAFLDKLEGTEKHLRVGINSALVDHGSLVGLLVEKGVITNEEYLEAVATGMEEEVARYEAAIARTIGANITLG